MTVRGSKGDFKYQMMVRWIKVEIGPQMVTRWVIEGLTSNYG